MKTKKEEVIVLRVDSKINRTIEMKSRLFNCSKSKFLRKVAVSYWNKNDTRFDSLFNEYNNADPIGKAEIVETLFNYYRETGFPRKKISSSNLCNMLNTVINTPSVLLENNLLQCNTIGIQLANYFHSHMYAVKHSNTKAFSPKEMFDSDEHLKDCINRCMELGKSVTHGHLLKILKARDGVRSVVNFKPAVAKFLYQTYVPENGKVLDPCAGYSGRLIGCIAANKNIYYEGIDPDGKTAKGNMRCASLFASKYDIFDRIYKFGFSFHLGCAEDIMPKLQGSYDFIFTSPPYFNVEKYSNIPNQSYLRYPTYEEWMNGFLYKIVNESKRLLTENGKLAINIKDYKKYAIATDLIKYCTGNGWKLETTYQMKLPNREYHLNKSAFHTEPIFVFGKSNGTKI